MQFLITLDFFWWGWGLGEDLGNSLVESEGGQHKLHVHIPSNLTC